MLLPTYDSRGGIGPLAALGVKLRELGAEAVVCGPPDCAERLTEVGLPLVPAGEPVRALVHRAAPPSPGDMPTIIGELIATWFGTAAEGSARRAAGCSWPAAGPISSRSTTGTTAAPSGSQPAGPVRPGGRRRAPRRRGHHHDRHPGRRAPGRGAPVGGDQPYFAARVAELGIGAAPAVQAPTAESLAAALGRALDPGTRARAKTVAGTIRADGARVAAKLLLDG